MILIRHGFDQHEQQRQYRLVHKQKKRSPTYKPLRVPDAVSEVTPKEIVQKQQTDQTLEKLRTLA